MIAAQILMAAMVAGWTTTGHSREIMAHSQTLTTLMRRPLDHVEISRTRRQFQQLLAGNTREASLTCRLQSRMAQCQSQFLLAVTAGDSTREVFSPQLTTAPLELITVSSSSAWLKLVMVVMMITMVVTMTMMRLTLYHAELPLVQREEQKSAKASQKSISD